MRAAPDDLRTSQLYTFTYIVAVLWHCHRKGNQLIGIINNDPHIGALVHWRNGAAIGKSTTAQSTQNACTDAHMCSVERQGNTAGK